MRVLHLVKTLDGADWAFKMVGHLCREGLEVHVCLPQSQGRFIEEWKKTGARLHFLDVSLTLNPLKLYRRIKDFKLLVNQIKPQLVHSHFVTNTLMMRLCLTSQPLIKKIFQVPGPLHLEHSFFRVLDLLTAGREDCWIASSRYIREIYLNHGVAKERVFLSYYGSDPEGFSNKATGLLREKYELSKSDFLIGNVNYFYAPKKYLFQSKGIKNHELLLALSQKLCAPSKLVLIGKQWGEDQRYFEKLKGLFALSSQVLLTGYLPGTDIKKMWADFDLAVHVPLSENCGGVIEPLMSGVPVIASRVGGLPEVIIEGRTGLLCEPEKEEELLGLIEQVRAGPQWAQEMAQRGSKLVRVMFDSKRTAEEIAKIYQHLIHSTPAPELFDSKAFVEELP